MLRETLTGGSTFDLLKRGLDVAALRQVVHGDNVANLGRPGFEARSVQFELALDHAMGASELTGTRTHPAHLPIGGSAAPPAPKVLAAPAADIESEMVALVENATKQAALVRLLDGRYQGLLAAIRGR